MSVEVTTYGNISKAIQEGSEKAILELTMRVTAQAKALAPVDQGELRNSIMYKTSLADGGFNSSGGESAKTQIRVKPKKGQGYVGTALLHGIYQEFGTRYMRAQPYLRPAIAIEANGANAKKVVKDFQIEDVNHEVRTGPRRTKRS